MKMLVAIGWRILVLLVGITTFFVTFALSLLAAFHLEKAPPQIGEVGIALFVAALLGVPTVAAVLVGRLLHRRVAHRMTSLFVIPRWLRLFAALAYLVTFAFGVPAVQSRANAWAVEEYKRLKASGASRVWPSHPYIATYFAAPVLPCVVLTYHEYQLGGLYGFGGFQLFFWYGTGVRPLGQLPLWVS